jgi:hypothetical protein
MGLARDREWLERPAMSKFVQLVSSALQHETFTVVDLGCSGGIDPDWRLFGERLRAVGVDASKDEIARLTAEETHPGVHYVAAWLDLPADHPFASRCRDKPDVSRDRRPETSSMRLRALRRSATRSLAEKLFDNDWESTALADTSQPVPAPALLHDLGVADVDLLKIDLDGPDFRVLNSFDQVLSRLNVIAARLEVHFFGGADDTEHSFHNTDRFMKAQGFELVKIEPVTYSMAALPAPFEWARPAQTVRGRAMYGEAYYIRDLASDEWSHVAASMSDEKLAKLAAVLSIWEQADSAAEILLKFRDRLRGVLGVDGALDLLAAQVQPHETEPLSYKDYVALFEAQSPKFFPPVWQTRKPSYLKKITTAWKTFCNPYLAIPEEDEPDFWRRRPRGSTGS